MLTVDEYRASAIAAVACPECYSAINHDNRSAAYHNFMTRLATEIWQGLNNYKQRYMTSEHLPIPEEGEPKHDTVAHAQSGSFGLLVPGCPACKCDPEKHQHTGPWEEVKPWSDVNRCLGCGTEIGK
jgi:hypothetical protein